MKALVFGGAGAVCSETTRDLAQNSQFDEINITEYNLDAANALAADIGDPRLKTEDPIHPIRADPRYPARAIRDQRDPVVVLRSGRGSIWRKRWT
jgi:saccharopine dehydrogenase-like NADP-dependent oxidoreductase